MKTLLDQNLPWGLRKPLGRHEVSRALDLSWAELENGELLQAAEQAGFDLFLTGDQNICYQQNLTHRRMAILELTTVHWPSSQHCFGEIFAAVGRCSPRSYLMPYCPYRGSRYRIAAKEAS